MKKNPAARLAFSVSHLLRLMLRKRPAIVALMAVLLVSAFVAGAYSEWAFSLVSTTARDLPRPLGPFLVSTLTQNSSVPQLSIDPVLLRIVGEPPEYTYDGDYESFKQSFDTYKYASLGFPEAEHYQLLRSSSIGDIQILERESKGDLEILRIDFSVVGGRLPGLLVRSRDASEGKTLIVVPGHPTFDDPLDDLVDESAYQKGIALHLARKGYTVFAMGLRGFNTSSLSSEDFQARASMKLYSWYGFLVSDALLLREHVAAKYQRPKNRIGFIGVSTGGAVSMFAGALADDVPFAIITGFFGSFAYNLVQEFHSRSGNIAGILNYFEMRDFLIAMAPRPVVVINGENDTFSAAHARAEFVTVQQAYEQLGAGGKAKIFTPENMGHEYDADLVVSVLDQIQDW